MLAFRRSARSFHGHQLFIGPRKVVQFNWVTGSGHVAWDLLRHRLSAWFKRAA
jgi:SM-20-related protein